MKLLRKIKDNQGFTIVLSIITLLWMFLIAITLMTLDSSKNNLIKIETLREQEHYEKVLNDIFKKMETIKVFTETTGVENLTQAKFDAFAAKTDFSNIGFVSFSIAPGGVMAYYYSEEYEDDLVGRDLVNDDRDFVREAVAYAIANDVVVINGPFELLHGGEGLVFRRAIYEDGEFAAIINLVVNSARLNALFTAEKSTVVDVGIYQTDNAMIFGNLPYSDHLMVLEPIRLDNVDWRIGVDVDPAYRTRMTMTDIVLVTLSLTLYLVAVYLGSKFYLNNKRLLAMQKQLIYFDGLTSLPNRMYLNEYVSAMIEKKKAFYLGFGDLDNFKTINDIMGHSVGDEYLRIAAERLQSLTDDILSIYRWGGDEFVFIVETKNKDLAIRYFDTIYEQFETPVKINMIDYAVSLSMGVVQYPRHGRTIDDLIKRADIVMYDVKQNNKKAYNFFENRYLDSLQREVDFENKINQYTFEDFEVYLQPIVDVKTGEIYGFEGLTRLFDKDGEPFNTADVIKVLERQGKIPELDKHVFDTICDYSKELKQTFGKDYYFSFNVSPVTLSEDFVDYLAARIKKDQLSPERFIFEIIETIGFKNIDESVFLLQKLREIGFQIAMDDFGMGYSSLSYIAKLPLSVIKIDRYFISNYYDNEFDRILIFAIRDISKSLQLKIVVEGIETERQLEFIKNLGAHYYQGYIHSRPVDLETLIDQLKNGF